MSEGTLGRLARVTLREQALEALRSRILTGEIPVGSHLNEVELTKRLGISRGTIREALRALQQEGLVAPDARARLRVKEPSDRDIAELYEVRAALEIQAGKRLLAEDHRDVILAQLSEALSAMEQETDVRERMEKDLQFHLILMQASGNRLLVDLWNSLHGKALIIASHCAGDEVPSVMTAAFHQPIIDALATGDEMLLHQQLDRHMQSAAVHWQGRLAEITQ